MKKITQNLMWLLTILSVLTFVGIGCKNTTSNSYSRVPKIYYTVASAQSAWAEALAKGEVTQEQNAIVRERDTTYRASLLAARSALIKWQDKPEVGPYWDSAMQDVDSARAKLVSTINEFLLTKKAPKSLTSPPMPK